MDPVDAEHYDGNNGFQVYNREVPSDDHMDNEVDRKLACYTASRSLLNDMPGGDDERSSLGGKRSQRSVDREDEYKRRRLNEVIEDMNRPLTDEQFDVEKEIADVLLFMKPQDYRYFGCLLNEEDEERWPPGEREMMILLLKVKNGTPPQREKALRQMIEFGGGPFFNCILPFLMEPTLEAQEKQLLVKVIQRVVTELDELVRPHVNKALAFLLSLLIFDDDDCEYYGREIIYYLSKAAGLASMIAGIRPYMNNIDDEYDRYKSAIGFSVVASALGIPALLPFIRKVCCKNSRMTWQARHTGIMMVGHIAATLRRSGRGSEVVPHLSYLVKIIKHGLDEENNEDIRTMTALSLAALAESAAPYGLESFYRVLKPLSKGIESHRGGKVLDAFLKAMGSIILLMDPIIALYYSKKLMVILVRSPDDETDMEIVFKLLKQCVSTKRVDACYLRRDDILGAFFKNYWVSKTALDRENSYKQQLVETTVEIANKAGIPFTVMCIVEGLKDKNRLYRRMVMETIAKIIPNLGASDYIIRPVLELLIDGILYAYQQQQTFYGDDATVMLNGFCTIVNSLGLRVKPYLPRICASIKSRLNHESRSIRLDAADLISRIAVVMKQCGEEQLMRDLGVDLCGCLGRGGEPPRVLGSILGALKAIVDVIDFTPPTINDLLTLIIEKYPNDKDVQEKCIHLVGRIANNRGAEFVPPALF